MKFRPQKTKALPKKGKAKVLDTSWLVRFTDQQDQVVDTCTFHNCSKEDAAKSAERHAENMRSRYDSWAITPLTEGKK